MGGRHARVMTGITLLSVTTAADGGSGGGPVMKHPYQETRLWGDSPNQACPKPLRSAYAVPMFTGFPYN